MKTARDIAFWGIYAALFFSVVYLAAVLIGRLAEPGAYPEPGLPRGRAETHPPQISRRTHDLPAGGILARPAPQNAPALRCNDSAKGPAVGAKLDLALITEPHATIGRLTDAPARGNPAPVFRAQQARFHGVRSMTPAAGAMARGGLNRPALTFPQPGGNAVEPARSGLSAGMGVKEIESVGQTAARSGADSVPGNSNPPMGSGKPLPNPPGAVRLAGLFKPGRPSDVCPLTSGLWPLASDLSFSSGRSHA